MESSPRNSDGRKRRRSSIENEIMEQRLQAWRTKKGLSTLSKVQEKRENRKLSLKHTTPSQPLKRKSIQMSKSEKKIESSHGQSKQARFYTPGSSAHHDVAINRRRTCSILQTNTQPGRRSLAPSTKMNTPQQMSNSMKRTGSKVTSLPNKRCEIPSSVKSQQAPIKSHDQSHDLPSLVQGRKSVRFFSPKISAAVESVQACEANTPATSNTTPGPSKNKLAMKERLEQWLVSKGKTPSRFHNFVGYESSLHNTPAGSFNRRRSGTPHLGRNRRDTPGRGTSASDERPVYSTMKECLEMLEEGCPLEDMSAWLDGMVTKVPLIQQCAGYWLCRAKIAEKQGGDQSAIECLFEAVQFNPEPVKDILDTLATYRLKLKMSHEESESETRQKSAFIKTGLGSPLRHTPCLEVQTPVAHLRFEEEDGNQSPDERDRLGGDTSHLSIKFSLKETIPYIASQPDSLISIPSSAIHAEIILIHQTIGHSPTTPCLLVTPVRRSARLDNKRRSVACLGSQLTCNLAVAECLDSLGEVAATYPKAQLILRPNRALTEEFSEADLED